MITAHLRLDPAWVSAIDFSYGCAGVTYGPIIPKTCDHTILVSSAWARSGPTLSPLTMVNDSNVNRCSRWFSSAGKTRGSRTTMIQGWGDVYRSTRAFVRVDARTGRALAIRWAGRRALLAVS